MLNSQTTEIAENYIVKKNKQKKTDCTAGVYFLFGFQYFVRYGLTSSGSE